MSQACNGDDTLHVRVFSVAIDKKILLKSDSKIDDSVVKGRARLCAASGTSNFRNFELIKEIDWRGSSGYGENAAQSIPYLHHVTISSRGDVTLSRVTLKMFQIAMNV